MRKGPAVQTPKYIVVGKRNGLSLNHIEYAKQQFHEADADKSGELDQNEVVECVVRLCKKFRFAMTKDIIQRIAKLYFSQVDADRSGNLSLEEFLELYAKILMQHLGEGKLNSFQKELDAVVEQEKALPEPPPTQVEQEKALPELPPAQVEQEKALPEPPVVSPSPSQSDDSQLEPLKQEIQRLTTENTQFQNEFQKLKEQYQTVASNNEVLLARLQKLDSVEEKLLQLEQSSAANSINAASKDQITELEKKLSQLLQDRENLVTIPQHEDGLNTTKAEITTRLEGLIKNLEGSVNSQTLLDELRKLECRFESFQNSTASQSTVDSMTQKLDELGSKIQQQESSLTQQLQEFQDNLNSNQNTITKVSSDLTSRVSNIEDQIKEQVSNSLFQALELKTNEALEQSRTQTNQLSENLNELREQLLKQQNTLQITENLSDKLLKVEESVRNFQKIDVNAITNQFKAFHDTLQLQMDTNAGKSAIDQALINDKLLEQSRNHNILVDKVQLAQEKLEELEQRTKENDNSGKIVTLESNIMNILSQLEKQSQSSQNQAHSEKLKQLETQLQEITNQLAQTNTQVQQNQSNERLDEFEQKLMNLTNENHEKFASWETNLQKALSDLQQYNTSIEDLRSQNTQHPEYLEKLKQLETQLQEIKNQFVQINIHVQQNQNNLVRLNEFEQKLESVNSDFGTLIAPFIQQLQAQITEQQAKDKENGEKISSLENNLTTLLSQLEHYNKSLGELQNQILQHKEYSANLKQLESQLQEVTKQLIPGNLQGLENQNNSSKLDEFEQKLNYVTNDLAAYVQPLQEQITDLQTKVNEKMALFETSVAKSLSQLEQYILLHKELQSQNTQNLEYSEKVKQLENQVQEITNQLAQINKQGHQNQDNSVKLEEFEQKLNNISTDFAPLIAPYIQTLQAQLREQQTKDNDNSGKITALEGNLKKALAELEQHNTALRAFQSETSQNLEYSEKIKQLENQLQEIMNQLVQINKQGHENQNNSVKLEEFEQKLNNVNNEIASFLVRYVQPLQAQITELIEQREKATLMRDTVPASTRPQLDQTVAMVEAKVRELAEQTQTIVLNVKGLEGALLENKHNSSSLLKSVNTLAEKLSQVESALSRQEATLVQVNAMSITINSFFEKLKLLEENLKGMDTKTAEIHLLNQKFQFIENSTKQLEQRTSNISSSKINSLEEKVNDLSARLDRANQQQSRDFDVTAFTQTTGSNNQLDEFNYRLKVLESKLSNFSEMITSQNTGESFIGSGNEYVTPLHIMWTLQLLRAKVKKMEEEFSQTSVHFPKIVHLEQKLEFILQQTEKNLKIVEELIRNEENAHRSASDRTAQQPSSRWRNWLYELLIAPWKDVPMPSEVPVFSHLIIPNQQY